MRTIAFLCLPPIQELDLFGPLDIFSTANFYRKNYEILILATDRSKKVTGRSGVIINANSHYSDFSGSIDTLIIIGHPDMLVPPKVAKWIQEKHKNIRRICSVCAGAFVLAETGLLKGRKATTHWMWEDKFKKQHPEVDLDISRIWTKDGKFYTSAGVSTGIDLALALVEEDFGSKAALKIAKGLVIFFRRSGSQKQFSEALDSQAKESDQFKDLTAWLQEHLQKNLSVDDLAHRVGMSSRNFYRQFKQTFGKSPAEHLRYLRLQKAKELLENGRLDWKKISSHCGMEGEALRRAFIKHNGISPIEYQKRYRP